MLGKIFIQLTKLWIIATAVIIFSFKYTNSTELNVKFSRIRVDEYQIGKSRMYFIQNNGIVLSGFGIVVRRGAKYDPPQYYGIAHLWEHMFFRNKIKNKSIKELLVNTQYNATTYNDYVSFYAVGDIYIIIPVFLEALFNPNFDQDSLDKEKGVVLAELSAKFQHAPVFTRYTNPTGGTIKTVQSISYKVMFEYMQNIRREDICFFIVSPQNLDSNVLKIFSNYYTDQPSKVRSFNISLQTNQYLYQSFLSYKGYLNKLNLSYRISTNKLYLYNNRATIQNQEIFFDDLISNYLKDKYEKDFKFRLTFLENFDIQNFDIFSYVQEEEKALVIEIELKQTTLSDEVVKKIKEFLLDQLRKIGYGEYKKVYERMYLELVSNLSSSWDIVRIMGYFVYSGNWYLLNCYVRGCFD
ncbi:MAG: insulinase family protein [bacterium]